MKKFWIWILSIVGVIILAIIVAYVFASAILGHVLTSSFGTKTTINGSAITFRSLRFWHLHVDNPEQSKTPYALTIKKTQVVAPLSTYFTNDVTIERVALKDLTLVVEVLPGKGNITNWDAIIDHINASNKDSKPSNKEATIKLLTIDNLKVKVISADGKVNTTTIDNLTFKDLSTKKGDITSQIAKVVIMKMIFNAQNIIKFPLQLSKDSYNNFFQNMKKEIKF